MSDRALRVLRWFRELKGKETRGEFTVDMFAGGGGTSAGIEGALGRPVEIAINHDADAIAIHKLNHPDTFHFLTDVREVDPRNVLPNRPLGALWLSPDCTHHSRAKGGKPAKRNRRALANVGVVWAQARRPRIIFLENVTEFEDWGPLDGDRPDKGKRGQSFKRWVGRLRSQGYVVDWRRLVAADFGAPTTRKRLFLVARRDGLPIVWPNATHAPSDQAHLLGLKPWRAVSECIDWTVPTRSIFGRRKPLAPATMNRIKEGFERFVLKGEPFIVQVNHKSKGFRGQSIKEPMRTITCSREGQSLVVAFLTQFNRNSVGQSMRSPLTTITSQSNHHGLCAFLIKYYQHGTSASMREPAPTITTKDRLGLVVAPINGKATEVLDIQMRMILPKELLAAQFGRFAKGYKLLGSITKQVKAIGNSVAPEVAEALVKANYKVNDHAQLEAA